MSDTNDSITLGGRKEGNAQSQTYADNNQAEYVKNVAESAGIPAEFVDMEFMVPTDEIELPSQGKYYPSGQKTVKVKYLTAEDENILTSPDLIKNGKVLDVLLNHAVIDKSLRPDDMLTGDKNAVLLALRSTGYGDDYEVKMNCPECTEQYKTSVKLSSLKHKPIQGESDQNGEFSVQLPKLRMMAKFRLLTGKDESYLTKKVESLKKLKKNTGESNLLTERYLLQIMEINGNRDKIYISNAISKMPISDSYFLREYIGLVDPGVNMEHEFECTNCGHVYEDTVPITAKLFWPNAKS
jgi:rubredoxin